jgi:hypothetical protein
VGRRPGADASALQPAEDSDEFLECRPGMGGGSPCCPISQPCERTRPPVWVAKHWPTCTWPPPRPRR